MSRSKSLSLQPSPSDSLEHILEPGVIELLRSRSRAATRGWSSAWQRETEPILRLLFWALVGLLLWLSFSVRPAQAQRQNTDARQHDWQMGTLTAKAKGKHIPLRLAHLQIRTKLDGRLVTTEVTHTFANNTNETIEGTFSFRLPPHSVLTRLAMSMTSPDEIMEGEIVEKQKAKRVYEKIVEQMRDPALLEMKRERLFQTRIYPIPAKSKKIVILRYHHVLPARGGRIAYQYQLPKVSHLTATTGAANAHKAKMRTHIDEIDLQLAIRGVAARDVEIWPYPMRQRQMSGGLLLQLKQKPFAPKGPLVVTLPKQHTHQMRTWHQPKVGKLGPFAAASIGLHLPHKQQRGPVDWLLLFDTSADTNRRDHQLGIQAAYTILQQMGPRDAFKIICGDTQQRSFATGWSPPDKRFAGIAFMARQQRSGGSHISALLKAGFAQARQRTTRIIYIGDGQASLGPLQPEQIVKELQALRAQKPKVALYGVAVGHRIDHEVFRQITAKNGTYTRLLLPETAHRKMTALIPKLRGQLLTNIKLSTTTPGVELYPKRHPAITSGTSIVIFAKSKATFDVTITGTFAGLPYRKQVRIKPQTQAQRNDLRFFFGARMLAAKVAKDRKERKRLVALSQQYGVMSRYTSLLVLENDKAYKQHNIKRRKHAARQRKRKKRAGIAKGATFSDWLRQKRQYQQHGGGSTSKIPQTYWSGSRGSGGGSGVGVSPDRVQPGDPVIQIRAPKRASSVYVILPHGEIKHARWVQRTKTWMVRFLVPNDLPDGVYHIQVIIVHQGGRIERRRTYYTVDTTAPRLSMQSKRLRRQGWVTLTATQRMRRKEVLASMARRYFKKNRRIPAWGYDLQRVYALTPNRKLLTFKRLAPHKWVLSTKLAPGTRLELSAVDSAGNIRIQRFIVR